MEIDKFKTMFNGAYAGKRVLVTGHTGFKGAWLTLWLTQLGAEVAGFSIDLPSQPCLFEVLGLRRKIRHFMGDVRDGRQIRKVFATFKPQMVFHLAAQPIVRTAYQEPKETFDTNLGGTVNVLECIRHTPGIQASVVITSDKCYENLNIKRGYREEDRLGGADPYSASKACAEIAFSAYYRSFFSHQDKVQVATARAGNVIGGGDWAKDRIVPDCVRAWRRGVPVVIRSPRATRPWQHVLEPVSGYLWLGALLLASRPSNRSRIVGGSFNFGPWQRASKDVGTLVDCLLSFWDGAGWKYDPSREKKKEALLLQLSPRKTERVISWTSSLPFKETVEFTARWYKEYYHRSTDMQAFSCRQIAEYTSKARGRGQRWAGGGGK